VEQKVPLNPRDQLLFCTPGVLEARDAQGEQFGPERLYKAILSCPSRGVHELRNEILYKVQAFSGIIEPERDQTVVALEVKDRVIKLAKTTSEKV
jgi:serine phosphatase RsbU (regulator of sigma subunit)